MPIRNEEELLRMKAEIDRFELYRVSQIHDPISKYRVNLVSLGRLGEEFSELLLSGLGCDPALEHLHIWHRIKSGYNKEGHVVDFYPEDSKADINDTLINIMTESHKRPGEERHTIHPYRALRKLEEIVTTSQNNFPSVGDITVVTARYDFSFTLKDDKGKVIRALNQKDKEDFKIIKNIIMTSVYIEDPYSITDSDIIDIMEWIKKDRGKIIQIVKDVTSKEWKKGSKEYWLNMDRAENLIDSIIGVRELGRVFPGYKGHIALSVNEVDSTHNAFGKSSKLDPRQMEVLCDNDQMRNEQYLKRQLRRQLKKRGRKLPRRLFFEVPTFGSHNEYFTPVVDLIKIGRHSPLHEEIDEEDIDFEKIRRDAVELGHKIFRYRGSSDKDAALALYNVVGSIMFKDRRSRRTIRSVVGFPKENYSIGMPVKRDDYGLQIPQSHLKKYMRANEEEIFEKGVTVQKYINSALAEEGILPREWEYEEFQPPIPSRERVSMPVIDRGESKEETGPRKVKLPSDLEVKLYARDKSAKGKIKRIAELDFKSAKPRYFSFDFEKVTNTFSSSFINFVADSNNLYALYHVITKERAHEYGLIIWDRKTQEFKKLVPFDEAPSSLSAFEGEVYVSFANEGKEIKKPIAIKRLSVSGKLLDEYRGIEGISDVAAGRIVSEVYIFGVYDKDIFIWDKEKSRRTHDKVSVGKALFDVNFLNQGHNILACSCMNDDLAFFYDSDGRKSVEYDSFKGIYDLQFLEDRILLATARLNDARPQITAFENIGSLFSKQGGSLLDPTENKLHLKYALDIRGLNIVNNLLMLYGTDDRIHTISWKEPSQIPLIYEPAPLNLNEIYLLREKC